MPDYSGAWSTGYRIMTSQANWYVNISQFDES